MDGATGRTHYLGLIILGVIIFRLIYAGRISLTVALLSVLISETIGILVGAISVLWELGDAVLMRFVEFMLTIPLAIAT